MTTPLSYTYFALAFAKKGDCVDPLCTFQVYVLVKRLTQIWVPVRSLNITHGTVNNLWEMLEAAARRGELPTYFQLWHGGDVVTSQLSETPFEAEGALTIVVKLGSYEAAQRVSRYLGYGPGGSDSVMVEIWSAALLVHEDLVTPDTIMVTAVLNNLGIQTSVATVVASWYQDNAHHTVALAGKSSNGVPPYRFTPEMKERQIVVVLQPDDEPPNSLIDDVAMAHA